MTLKDFLHRFESRIAVLAALALLFAQLGALSHAYSHDAAVASTASTHRTGAAGHDPCNECLAYAPLLCAAGAPAALPVPLPQSRGLATRTTAASLLNLDLTLAFRSRAPPLTA